MLQSDSDDRKRLSTWARAREVAGKIPEKRVVGAARVLSVLGADTRPRRVGSSPAGASMSRAGSSVIESGCVAEGNTPTRLDAHTSDFFFLSFF